MTSILKREKPIEVIPPSRFSVISLSVGRPGGLEQNLIPPKESRRAEVAHRPNPSQPRSSDLHVSEVLERISQIRARENTPLRTHVSARLARAQRKEKRVDAKKRPPEVSRLDQGLVYSPVNVALPHES